ncbi:MAG: CocE/NonD family hydrolase, partial [Candidatus Hydrogenedentota bacterium]
MKRDYRGMVPRFLLVAAVGFGAVASAFLPEGAPFESSEAAIPLRDGKSLAADVYVPDKAKNYPVILIQTPYDKSRMRTWWAKADSSERGTLFTDTHYAFVVTDWRDRFASKAAAAPGKIAGNGEDGYDTIDWIVKQPWCNGKVGTWGPSALGAVQYRTMTQHHPNHVCAVPMVMPLNLEYGVYFHGGVLWDEFVTMLAQLGWPLRDQLIAHPVHDAFWTNTLERTFIRPDELKVPMLIIGGWYDIYTSAVIDTLLSIRDKGDANARGKAHLIMGPWLHRTGQVRNGGLEYPSAENYDVKQAQRFFDHWLRGESNGADDGAPITYFQMGEDQWKTADSWPPAGMTERSLE